MNQSNKAVVLRLLERVSGYSRQQISGQVKRGSERLAQILHELNLDDLKGRFLY